MRPRLAADVHEIHKYNARPFTYAEGKIHFEIPKGVATVLFEHDSINEEGRIYFRNPRDEAIGPPVKHSLEDALTIEEAYKKFLEREG